MIDASDEPLESADSATTAAASSGCPMTQHSPGRVNSDSKQKLSNKEIVDICVGLLVAGYDTTSSTLSFTSYLLALNPDLQKKLQSEIDAYFDSKPVSEFTLVCILYCAVLCMVLSISGL